MKVCQIRIGDGRDDYHDKARASIDEMWPLPDYVIEIDDRDHRLGFAGAIALAWDKVRRTNADYVAHLELDFTYTEQVEQDRMIGCLERHPHLVQMSLKRQPVNGEEVAAGDFVKLHPEDYREQYDGYAVWTETRRFFTTNPSLYPVNLCYRGWPQVQHSEGVFSIEYFREHPHAHTGIWGAKFDEPRCIHIGDVRAGTGY